MMLIGGTTASGKSALALRFAEATNALVVNADAQQLYRDLPVLTARPSAGDLARAAHRLYGMLGPEVATSAGAWLRWLEPVISEAERDRRPLCLVGGTGLYMKALLEGLAPVPPIPEAIERRLRSDPRPTPALYAELCLRDPAMAARLRPNDRQRILRALAVVEATGRSLLELQALTQPAFDLRGPVVGIALLPPRDRLWQRISERFAMMLRCGVLEEVKALAERLPQLETLPIARVHGCRELLRAVRGEWRLEQATERTIIVTRQYAKRQSTFFRRQLTSFVIYQSFGEELADRLEELLAALARRPSAAVGMAQTDQLRPSAPARAS